MTLDIKPAEPSVVQGFSMPTRVRGMVEKLAEKYNTSMSRVVVALIEQQYEKEFPADA